MPKLLDPLGVVEVPPTRSLQDDLNQFIGRPMSKELRSAVAVVLRRHGMGMLSSEVEMPRILPLKQLRMLIVGDINEKMFKLMTGEDPMHDDLERANCPDAGTQGHLLCGICEEHERPQFYCGCAAKKAMSSQ